MAIGFLSSGGKDSYEPAPPKGKATTSVSTPIGEIDANHLNFARPHYALAFVSGLAQAVSAINQQRDLCPIFQILLEELDAARSAGITRTAALARADGFCWGVSGALLALARQGVRLNIGPVNQDELCRALERHNGVM